MSPQPLPPEISDVVSRALAEDLGAGDITAALIGSGHEANAEIRVKESAVLCGTAWFDEVFRQLDASVAIQWRHEDGADLTANTTVCDLRGPAKALLSGERTALNFLQTLSGTATAAHRFAQAAHGTNARILDTRKTLPGLRTAQKYAVRCGGGHNHRAGLFDAVLIKENHIAALGGITEAVRLACESTPSVLIEVEVENLDQLREALDTAAGRLLLDNFSLDQLREAVRIAAAHGGERKELEASGGVELDAVRAVAETGVDWVSIGAMTKHLRAIDYSMRFV